MSPNIDDAVTRLNHVEASVHRQRIVNMVLAVALLLASSGWWLTSQDHAASRRNGKVADCRAVELAITLDDYQPFVRANASGREKSRAAADLARIGPLVPRYEDCAKH